MSTTYPSLLPRPMLSGYSLKVSGANTATEMDRGSPRRRRTATKSKTILDFSIALTETQYAIFAAWWRYDLYDGTLPATMKILNGYADDPMPVRFLKPYTATDMVGKWYISCQIEFEPFRLSEEELDAMIAGGTIYTVPPEEPGGPPVFPFYGYLRITQQPVSVSVLAPDSATFTIAAVSSILPISYQWKKNGVNVGTNSTTYNTGATTWTGTDDVITCVVSNGVSSVTSDNAILNVRKSTAASLPDFSRLTSDPISTTGFFIDGLAYFLYQEKYTYTLRFTKGNPETGSWSDETPPISVSSGHVFVCPGVEDDGNCYWLVWGNEYAPSPMTSVAKMCIFNKSSKSWTVIEVGVTIAHYNDRITGLCYEQQTNKISFIRSAFSGGNGYIYFFDTQTQSLSSPVFVGSSGQFFLQPGGSAKLFKTQNGYSFFSNGTLIIRVQYPGTPSITSQSLERGFYDGGTIEHNGVHYCGFTSGEFWGVDMETGSVIRKIAFPRSRTNEQTAWQKGMMAVNRSTNTIYYITTERSSSSAKVLWCCKFTV